MRRSISFSLATLMIGLSSANLRANVVPVLNGSFENPSVVPTGFPALPFADSWITTGPGPFFPIGSISFNSGTGVFPNPASGSAHFDNADGDQLGYIFTDDDLNGHRFQQQLGATFQAGQQYSLTLGVGLATAAPSATDIFRIQLVYFTVADPTTPIPVATREVVNDIAHGLSGSHLIDFSAVSSFLTAGDGAVGRPINILLSTDGTSGKQYDFDNVRVTFVPEPASLALAAVGSALLLRRRRSFNIV